MKNKPDPNPTEKKPFHNSAFRLQPCALIPVYHWRGARPWLLDLEPEQSGWLIGLCLHREGDICLLPLAWQINNLEEENQDPSPYPHPQWHTAAHDQNAISLTLANMQRDDWQVQGHLTVHFSGRETRPDFNRQTRSYLWQTPRSDNPIEKKT